MTAGDGHTLSYNAKNQTSTIDGVAMGYTGATQAERVTAGSTSYQATVLGLDHETTNGVTTYYIRDNQGQLVSERIGTSRYYYLYDALGSTIMLTDQNGGQADTYNYDPYGLVTSSTGTIANPYRFGGAYGGYTDGSGLVKIGQRYSDANLGRWSQQDLLPGSLVNPSSLNRYAYAGCAPVNSVDPTGLSVECAGSLLAAEGSALVAAGGIYAALGEGFLNPVANVIAVGGVLGFLGSELLVYATC